MYALTPLPPMRRRRPTRTPRDCRPDNNSTSRPIGPVEQPTTTLCGYTDRGEIPTIRDIRKILAIGTYAPQVAWAEARPAKMSPPQELLAILRELAQEYKTFLSDDAAKRDD